jgi:hypothetical protein
MKKNNWIKGTFLGMLVVVAPFVGYSQNNEGHFTDIRVFGGVNLSSLSSEGTQLTLVDSIIHEKGVDAELGYQGGVSVTFGNHFYISPGIWYTKFTVNSFLIDDDPKTTYDDVNFEKESSITMLTLPVRFGFRFINPQSENIFNVRLFGGVTGQHILSVSTSGDSEIELDKDDYENVVVSATGGLGVDVLFLFMDLGYDLGLTNFEKSSNKSRHNSMFVNLGVKFKI